VNINGFMVSYTECRAFGLVSSTRVRDLADLLRGLCQQYGFLGEHEVVLSVPMQEGTSTTSVKLTRNLIKEEGVRPNPFKDAQCQPERWLVQHEGLPMRGANVSGLPAAVREINESYSYDKDTPDFFLALGAKHDYELVKKGNEYHCVHAGHALRVQLLRVTPVPPRTQNPDAVQMASKFMLNVTTHAAEGLYVEAAQAVGSFAQRLAPLLVLQPAIV